MNVYTKFFKIFICLLYFKRMCLMVKKRFFINFLIISILAIHFQLPVFALEQDSTEEQDFISDLSLADLLNLKIVGASKKEESVLETPMSVHLITKEDLDNWMPRHFYEAVGMAPGNSFYFTNFGFAGGAMTRGTYHISKFTAAYELLPIIETGWWSFPIHFFKNIEVIRGPGGLAWGGSATAGVMNCNFRDDLEGTEVHLTGGNYRKYGVDLLYGKKFKGGKEGDGMFVGFHTEGQDPVRAGYTIDPTGTGDPTYNESTMPLYYLGVKPSWVAAGKIKSGPFKLVFYKDNHNEILSLAWRAEQTLNMPEYMSEYNEHEGIYSGHCDQSGIRGEYQFLNTDMFKGTIYAENSVRNWYVNALANFPLKKYATGWSIDMYLLDNQLELNAGGEFWSRYVTDDASFWVANDSITWANNAWANKTDYNNAYLQLKYKIFNDKLTLIAGGRWDRQKDAPTENAIVGPRAGVIFNPLDDKLIFKYLYNNTLRRPTGIELAHTANPPNPEKIGVHEIVAIYNNDNLLVNTTFFIQELKDKISAVDPAKQHLPGFQGFKNSGGERIIGLEWGIKYIPIPMVRLTCNGILQQAKFVASDSSYQSPHLSDGRLPFVPLLSNTIGCEVSIKDIVYVNPGIRTSYKIPYFKTDGSEGDENANFLDLNIRTKEFMNMFSVSLHVYNVLNEHDGLPAFNEEFRWRNGTVEPIPRMVALDLKLRF